MKKTKHNKKKHITHSKKEQEASSVLPSGFVPKPIPIYKKQKAENSKTPYNIWIERRIEKYTRIHKNLNAYTTFKKNYFLFIIFCIVVLCIGVFLMWDSDFWLDKETTINNKPSDFILEILGIIFTIIAILMFFVGSIYIAYFFYTSLSIYKKTPDFTRMVDKYNGLDKLNGLKKNTVHNLYEMDFISKEVFNLYKKTKENKTK